MSIFSIRKICISRPQSELFQKVRRTRQIIRFKEEKSGETEAYPAANFNAGKAYEKLNNKEKALQNYQLAYKRSPDSQYTRIIKLETTIIPKKTNFYRYGLTRIITRRLRSRFPGIGFPKASSLGY